MDVWKWTAIAAALWAIAGCHTPQAITALERENRMLEDQIYMLEDELSRAESALEACQSGKVMSARPGGVSSSSPPTPPSFTSPSLQGPRLPAGGRDVSDKSRSDPTEFRLPEVESGRPLPPGVIPDTLAPSARGASPSPPLEPAGKGTLSPPARDVLPSPGKPSANRSRPRSPKTFSARSVGPRGEDLRRPPPGSLGAVQRRAAPFPSGRAIPEAGTSEPPSATRHDSRLVAVQAIALDPRADNTRADRITLNRSLTGGYSRDPRFGDAGVSVLIEPRDVHGRLVPAPGPVSVVVLDRGRSGDAARVARWDYSTEQIATLYRKTPYGEGFYLEMPWPGSPPTRGHLHLFVRYTTQDGRHLEASCELDVVLPDHHPKAWVPLVGAAAEPRPTETAAEWRPKAREDESSFPSSSVVASSPGAGGPSMASSTVVPTSAAVSSGTAAPQPPAARRPTWSPFRPEE